MQRQSLGSPAAKHLPPVHGEGEDDDDGKKKRKKKAGGGAGALELDEAGEGSEVMPERPFRRNSVVGAASAPAGAGAGGMERSIHLIPVLTLFCFLVLYLCSHDPSSTDMADLGGVGRLFDHTVSKADIGGGGGGVSAAVRGHRSLKELERLRGHHSSRKLGRRRAA